jgi:SAM-dependent methyltransferase
MKTDSGNNSFIQPRLSLGELDVYFVRRSILNELKTHIKAFQGTLLDVGCGQMPYKRLLTSGPSRVTQYIGLDLANNPIHKNHPDITWQDGKIPLADGSVDCAIATEVFEHCPDLQAIMHEIYRVLKPGGLLFFTVPFFWPLHEVPYDEYRYTPFALERHLAASGFVGNELNPLGGWDASLAQMLGLWVRRRPMKKWKRRILTCILMPLIYGIHQMDKRLLPKFQESTMITGLSGTARKPEKRISAAESGFGTRPVIAR